MSDKEMYRTVDMLTEEIRAEDGVIDLLKAGIELGSMVCFFQARDGALATLFREEAESSIFKS